MGCFTFTFANKKLEYNQYGCYLSKCKLGYGYRGYIALSKNFSTLYPDLVFNKEGYPFIKENYYDGYGMFGVHDIYDVVVDMNKGHLVEALNRLKIKGKKYNNLYYTIAKMLDDGMSDSDITTNVEKDCCNLNDRYLIIDWKRCLGIRLACYLEDNELLPYPLKVVSTLNCNYDELPASDSTQ